MRNWFVIAVLAAAPLAHAGPPDNVCTNLATTTEGAHCTGAAA